MDVIEPSLLGQADEDACGALALTSTAEATVADVTAGRARPLLKYKQIVLFCVSS